MTSSVQLSDPGSYKLDVIFHQSQVTQVAGNGENITWKEEEDIGGGGYNIVKRQKAVVAGKESYRAVKSISRDFTTKNGFDFQRQVQALILMQDHPDLFIEFSGWYEDKSWIYIVMEYAPLGNLGRYIKEFKHDAHSNVIGVTQQLLEALVVLHEKSLYHRNLKPSNVLITSLTPLHIKLVDFEGYKSTINSEQEISHGTMAYSAPEMLGYLDPVYRLGREHPYAIDIWALGCLVHEILTGETPFSNQNFHGTELELSSNQNDNPDLNLLASFCLGNISFPAEKLETPEVDKEAVDFIRRLLVAKPYSRPSAQEALDHVWLVGCRSYESFKLETVVYEDRVAHTTPGPTDGAIVTEWTNVAHIGAGGFGSVVLERGVVRGVECGLRAVKRVNRDFHKFGLSREVSAMVAVRDRPEMFVRLFGWFETSDYFCIAMEYLEHGDLGDYLSKKGKEMKSQIADITSQILKGLVVLHQRKICHRDLKPQNVLIASLSPIRVKLADFGVSKLAQGSSLKSLVGTAGYTAPELLGLYQSRKKRNSNSYTNAIDMWSLGCMVYKMLAVSKLPFSGEGMIMDDITSTMSTVYTRTQEPGDSIDMEKFCNFCEGRIDLPVQALYDSTTPKGLDFVKRLLVANPELRMMAKAALEHDWLTEQPESSDTLEVTKTQLIALGISPATTESFILAYREGGKPETIQGILTAVGKSPESLSHDASDKGYDLLLDMLLNTFTDIINSTVKGRTLMQTAARGGHLGVVKLLLKYGADVNAEPGPLPSGRTALQAATEYGHLHLVKFLLEKGADIHGKPAQSRGLTALQAAASRGQSEILRILTNLKTDLNEEPCKSNGRTALQAAAENGHIAAVNFLLHHGAKVNAAPCEETGRTALQAAAGNGHVNIVKILLENSADVNASPCASWGRTALQAAAEKGHLKVVKLLLEKSADVNAGPCKKGGRSALWAAAEMGHCDVVRLLLEHGADCSKCVGGLTALEIAEENGNFEIAELLSEYFSG